MSISSVDICVGLSWGDEGKGKIVSHLSSEGDYDFVCRWSGGNNAGHTVFVNEKSYSTHLIPSGIFYGIKSIIGPGCVIHINSFMQEIRYLQENNFDTSLIKISPKAHVVLDKHIADDIQHYSESIGTTNKGIGPCYTNKYQRTGIRLIDYINGLGQNPSLRDETLLQFVWDEELYGKILCEGAQGFWLDIDYGNYPYVTSSSTLPYGACSLGFSPKKINKIFGAAKIYDTRVGIDPEFPETLLDVEELQQIGEEGREYGTTTGRKRIVNYLNVDKLINAINISGTTDLIISKVDVLENVGVYKYLYKHTLNTVSSMDIMKQELTDIFLAESIDLHQILYSNNPYHI